MWVTANILTKELVIKTVEIRETTLYILTHSAISFVRFIIKQSCE